MLPPQYGDGGRAGTVLRGRVFRLGDEEPSSIPYLPP